MNPMRPYNPRARRVIVAVLLGCATIWAQASRERADQLYRQKDFRAAAAELLAYLDRSPADYEALLLLGLSLEQMGDPTQAEKVFTEALRRRPKDAQARLFLARTQYLQGRFDSAGGELATAREQGADPQRADYLTGLILLEQGNSAQALEAFRRAGDFSDAPVRASAALLALGRPREALAELEGGPDDAAARYQRALALAALDEREAAIRVLRKTKDHPQAQALLERLRRMPARNESASADSSAEELRPVAFEEVGDSSGIDFVLDHHPTAEKYLPETMAGGLAIFDTDGDGLLDLFFTNGAVTPTLEKRHPRQSNRLYRNLGGFRFEDVTARARLEGEGFSIGTAVADYDADGDVDLFVAGVHRNLLYRNRGDGVFDEVSAETGVGGGEWTVGGGWLDADGDGLLDLFVAAYLQWDPEQAPVCQENRSGVRTYCHPKFFQPQPNRLYRNRGDGTFEDVTVASGIGGYPGKAMAAAFSDIDLDGDLDIFVPNDAIPNFLFVNDGDGVFEESALERGVAVKDDGQAVSSMGAAFGDVDADGRPDLLFTALPGETFPHFHNEGEGLFLDRTYRSGIGTLSRPFGGWGVALADFNNDGRLDVITANAHVMDNAAAFSSESYEQPGSLWLGRGDGTFVDASKESGFAARPAAHRGLAVADLDQDGRLDAVVTVLGDRPEIWRNVSPDPGCWIQLRLDSIGAKVRIGGQTLEYATTSGYGASVQAPLHVGLGSCAGPIPAEVTWPDGSRQSLEIAEGERILDVRKRP